jgi:hypothetical protein
VLFRKLIRPKSPINPRGRRHLPVSQAVRPEPAQGEGEGRREKRRFALEKKNRQEEGERRRGVEDGEKKSMGGLATSDGIFPLSPFFFCPPPFLLVAAIFSEAPEIIQFRWGERNQRIESKEREREVREAAGSRHLAAVSAPPAPSLSCVPNAECFPPPPAVASIINHSWGRVAIFRRSMHRLRERG